MNEFYVIITACLVAATCALLGCFLILRRMVMVGDAISHAVLPGIVIAFLLTGTLNSLPMLFGASLTGFLTTLIIEWLHQKARLQQDASIGVTFTLLFAIGVILISYYTSGVDLDLDCVLYGEIAYVGLGEDGIPMSTKLMAIVFIGVVIYIYSGFKELMITSFDPAFATSIGVVVWVWHYSLMGLVSVTTVAAFESVGSILVVAFLIAPAATAYLITEKLSYMLCISVICGIVASVGGYYLAVFINGSIAGAMSAVAGLEFLLVFISIKLKMRYKEKDNMLNADNQPEIHKVTF